MLIHLIWALWLRINTTLSSLVDHHLVPCARDQIKPEESFTESEAFSPTKKVEAVLKITEWVAINWTRYGLTSLVLCDLCKSMRLEVEHPEVVHVTLTEICSSATVKVHAVACILIQAGSVRDPCSWELLVHDFGKLHLFTFFTICLSSCLRLLDEILGLAQSTPRLFIDQPHPEIVVE